MINMDINNIKQIISSMPICVTENIIAAYIYGSVARGDNDSNSDCDVLICVNNCDAPAYDLLKAEFFKKPMSGQYEFSFYQLNVLKEMQKKRIVFPLAYKKRRYTHL